MTGAASLAAATLALDPDGHRPVCVVEGFNVRLVVDRGHLVVEDGWLGERRVRRYSRADRHLRRVVIRGRGGSISLAALSWMEALGVGFVHLGPNGELLAASGAMGLDDPRLRRVQAASWGDPTSLAIARWLLERKLAGQARIAHRLGRIDVATEIQRCVARLPDAQTAGELMVPEAAAASAYWSAWADLPVHWVTADAPRVPAHWRRVGGRASAVTGHPRSATTPVHALLNYGFRLLEAEARLACLAMGLDPGLGVLHADQKARDSLALDVSEAGRQTVDEFVIDLLEHRTFRRRDFHESGQGVVRVLPPLSHQLLELLPHLGRQCGPIVEHIAQSFANAPSSRVDRMPTKLTESNRSTGRRSDRSRPVPARPSLRSKICRDCGQPLERGDRARCDACLRTARIPVGLMRLQDARATAAERRARGDDPCNSAMANEKRRRAMRAHEEAKAAWRSANAASPDPEWFRSSVLPRLQEVPVRQLARATGLSVTYCSLVRRGLAVPEPRHWQGFELAARPVT